MAANSRPRAPKLNDTIFEQASSKKKGENEDVEEAGSSEIVPKPRKPKTATPKVNKIPTLPVKGKGKKSKAVTKNVGCVKATLKVSISKFKLKCNISISQPSKYTNSNNENLQQKRVLINKMKRHPMMNPAKIQKN